MLLKDQTQHNQTTDTNLCTRVVLSLLEWKKVAKLEKVLKSFTLPRKQGNDTERCVCKMICHPKNHQKWKIKRDKRYGDGKGDKKTTKNSDEFVELQKR